MKQGKVTFETEPDRVYQQGTPLTEVPKELMEYIALKYQQEPLTAALLEKVEREVAENNEAD